MKALPHKSLTMVSRATLEKRVRELLRRVAYLERELAKAKGAREEYTC